MDNKENEIVAEKDTFRAVIYTDGSMYHPNNNQIGYTGSSAHGYIYNIKERKERIILKDKLESLKKSRLLKFLYKLGIFKAYKYL